MSASLPIELLNRLASKGKTLMLGTTNETYKNNVKTINLKEHLVSNNKIDSSLFDLPAIKQLQTYGLIIVDGTKNMSDKQIINLLELLRNRLIKEISIIYHASQTIDHTQLIALGFSKNRDINNTHYSVYSYSIKSYNQKRKWNNSKHWANPENFDKYRW